MSSFDLVIRGGTVVTAADRFPADIGVRDGRIVALGEALDRGEEELDASGKLVLPGGIDSHVHLDQPSPETGARSANDFRSGSISAACGGNTTILPFVRQLKGQSLRQAVTDYHERADGRSAIDYAFHLIVADPTAQVLGQELPALFHDGYTSVKVYMTYDSLKLADGEILRVLDVVREHGAMTMVHAENADCIAWLTEKLLDRGHTAPKYKAIAHAPPEEREATHRAITLAELAGVPILIVHVASGEAAEQIRWAQRRGLRVYAETCPQYLFLTEADIDKPDMEGAKCICAPPPGSAENQRALWSAFDTGVFQVFSSDHAPFRYDDPKGKLVQRAQSAVQPHHERAPGHRGADADAVLRRGGDRPHGHPPVRRAHVHQRGEALRPLSAQGDHRRRLGRGPRRLGPRSRGHHERRHPPRRDGLHALRGDEGHGLAGGDAAARGGGLPRLRVHGRRRGGAVPAVRGAEPAGIVAAAGGCGAGVFTGGNLSPGGRVSGPEPGRRE